MKRMIAASAAVLFVLALSVPAFATSHMKGESAAKEPAAVKTDNTVEKDTKGGKDMKKEAPKPKKQKKESSGC
jgi:hypothetical protein